MAGDYDTVRGAATDLNELARADLAKDFWNHAMMRVCYTSEALQHFVIALSSQDEAFRLRASCPGPSDLARTRYLFSLKQYSKAIEKAVDETRHGESGLVMVVSAVFCFLYELWFGDMLGAQKHVLSAEKLIHAQDLSADKEQSDLLIQHIQPTVTRLCAQFSNSSSALGAEEEPYNPDMVPQSPLKNYAEAKVSLEPLANSLFSQIQAYQKLRNHDVDKLL